MKKLSLIPVLLIGLFADAQSWSLTGNININRNSNFIGTTDNNDVLFRRNNIRAGLLSVTNTSFGQGALLNDAGGGRNTAIGSFSLFSNTTGPNNVANGYHALNRNTIGNGNTAIGTEAMYVNTTGNYNTGVGLYALHNNDNGERNTAIGDFSLLNNILGSFNTASGSHSLQKNMYGFNNTSVGSFSSFNSLYGNYNSNFGTYSMYSNIDGNYNAAVGGYALSINTTGHWNTAIGYQADVNDGAYNNTTTLGAFAVATQSDQVRIGNEAVTSIGGKVGWSTFSDGRFKKNIQENVPGLAFIKQLKPVTYNLDITGYNKRIAPPCLTDSVASKANFSQEMKTAIAKQEQTVYTGFIAQDVEAIAKKMNYSFSGVDVPEPDNAKSTYALRYAEFVVPLVKAVQELSTENEALRDEVKNLQLQMKQVFEHLQAGTKSPAVNQTTLPVVNPSTVKVYPNPNTGSFIISGNTDIKDAVVQVYDMSGKPQPITVTGNGTNQKEIKMNAPAGIYQLKLMTARETISVQLVVQ